MFSCEEKNKLTWDSIFETKIENYDVELFKEQLQKIFIPKIDPILKDFKELSYTDFINIAPRLIDVLPSLLYSLNLKIRKYSGICHSCIITDEEVEATAIAIYEFLINQNICLDVVSNGLLEKEYVQFDQISRNWKRFYREIVYCIPVSLKDLGFELIKPSETKYLKQDLADSIARLFHERYRYLMKNQDFNDELKSVYKKSGLIDNHYFNLSFDQLDDKIKNSNIDSAYHIPTKLLAIGYYVERNDSNYLVPPLLKLSVSDIETMAKIEHERWCWEKRLSGFRYGQVKSDITHPCLVPYDELSEFEKDKDRDQVALYPLVLRDLGFWIKPFNQNVDSTYKYRISSKIERSMSIIDKQINSLGEVTEREGQIVSHEKIIDTRNQLLVAISGLKDIRDSIRRSENIQNNLFASKILFRTYLPDSFILFKPLDIVSGDFYFISKVEDKLVFALADCTGHGIPGGMLSMICHNFLDIAINENKILEPAQILKFVFPKIESLMRRNVSKSSITDSMDIVICTIDIEERKLSYAGVNRPLLLIREDKIMDFKPLRVIGNKSEIVCSQEFKSDEITLNSGDQLYVFSDGIVDQFGGDKDFPTKFSLKKLSKILIENSKQPMFLQSEIIEETIEEWINTAEADQTDDILLIGVKI